MPKSAILISPRPPKRDQMLKNTTEAQIGYIAGMLDGEGTISISWTRENKTMAVAVSIANTYKKALKEIRNWLGTGSITKQQGIQAKLANHKLCWVWRVGGTTCIEILKRLEPHLIIKKSRARVAIEFFERRQQLDIRKAELSYAIMKRAEGVDLDLAAAELKKLYSYESRREQCIRDILAYYKIRDLAKRGNENYTYIPKRVCPLQSPAPGDKFISQKLEYTVRRVDALEGVVHCVGKEHFALQNWKPLPEGELKRARLYQGLQAFDMLSPTEVIKERYVEPEIPHMIRVGPKQRPITQSEAIMSHMVPPPGGWDYEIPLPPGVPKPLPRIIRDAEGKIIKVIPFTPEEEIAIKFPLRKKTSENYWERKDDSPRAIEDRIAKQKWEEDRKKKLEDKKKMTKPRNILPKHTPPPL